MSSRLCGFVALSCHNKEKGSDCPKKDIPVIYWKDIRLKSTESDNTSEVTPLPKLTDEDMEGNPTPQDLRSARSLVGELLWLSTKKNEAGLELQCGSPRPNGAQESQKSL